MPTDRAGAGHRLLVRAGECVVEAWAPDLAGCVAEALAGVVGSFAEVPDAAATRTLPLAAISMGPEDVLASLLEEVIDAVDVFGVVPVRFHLGRTEDGGVAGDMEVVPVDQVHVVGAAPTRLSQHHLHCDPQEGAWHCRVTIER